MSSDGTQPSNTATGWDGGDKGAGDSGSSSSKVNAIWQQLKSAHSAPKTQGINFNKLWHGFSSEPAQGKIKASTKAAAGHGTYQGQLIDRTPRISPEPAPNALPQQQPQPQQQHPAPGTKPDEDTALQLVARCVAGLKDSSQTARRTALQDVQRHLLDNPALSEQWLTERLEGDGLGKALLRRFDDLSDACREMAVTSLLRLLQAAPQAVLSLLPYAFPVVSERVRHREEGSKSLTEPCEEVRLALARLLHYLVVLAGKSFGGYAGEAVELLGALCEDPFHEVQEEACAVVVAMNEVLGFRLQPVSKQLVAVVLPLTTAKRHRVRTAALQALRPTMYQGAHEMILEMVAWRDPNVIPIKAFYGDDLKVNFCGKLAADPHPAVRREFLSVIGEWMTSLRERLDHEARLLPFVLSALNDEAPEIQADAVALLERLGIQYEQDHEKDLKDTTSYLPEEAHGIGWQAPGAAGYVYGAIAAGEETVNGGRAVFVLPSPLRTRPRLGTRRLVQSNFGRIVGPLCEEVGSWLLEARRRAAALLRAELVLVEEWSEQHLHVLLPALARAISDPEVRPLIRDCAAIIGAFTEPELALQLLQPRLAEEATDLAQRAAVLEVLACIVRGAGPRRAMDSHLAALLELLSLESVITSEDTRVRRALLELVEQLISTCGPACGRHTPRLMWVCLHLRAPGRASLPPLPLLTAAVRTAGEAAAAGTAATGTVALGGGGGSSSGDPAGAVVEASLLPRLAEVCGFSGGVEEMLEAHRRELMAQVDPASSPNVLLATSVLCRLVLPYSSLSHLLYLPEDVLGRVLPPEPPSFAAPAAGPVPMEVDDNDSGNVAAAAAPTVIEDLESGDHRAAPADAAASSCGAAAPASLSPSNKGGNMQQAQRCPHLHIHRWHWRSPSTCDILSRLKADLAAAWLPCQPRCALMYLVSLEACLANLPVLPLPQPAARAAAEAAAAARGQEEEEASAELLAAVLSLALGACQELSPPALLTALRCAHVALRRRLLVMATTATTSALRARHVVELVHRLADCMGMVSSAACRLQACYVMEMLVREKGDGNSDDGVLPAICTAVSARLYDAADEVRCAALAVARQVVTATAEAVAEAASGGPLEPGGGGAVARLLAEIAQLRDVSPGSGFYDEYNAFRAWMDRIGHSGGVYVRRAA